MHSHNATLYPMLAVGAFMSMFWTGVVVGYELGAGCMSMLITGLLFGCIASVGVCELQRRDAQGLAGEPHAATPGQRRPGPRHTATETASAAPGRAAAASPGIHTSLPVGSS